MAPAFVATVRVVDDGGPLQGATLERYDPTVTSMFGPKVEEVAISDGEGRVVVRGLSCSRTYEFSALLRGQPLVFPGRSTWVSGSAGHPEVELYIPSRGHRMTIRSPGARRGQRGFVFAEDTGPASPMLKPFEFAEAGVTHVEQVGSGRYSVYVINEGVEGGEGRTGKLGPFRFPDGQVTVSLSPKVALRVRPVAPDGTTDILGVVLLHGLQIPLVEGAAGVWASDLLPAGVYRVCFIGRCGGHPFQGEELVKTGHTAEIALVPSKP